MAKDQDTNACAKFDLKATGVSWETLNREWDWMGYDGILVGIHGVCVGFLYVPVGFCQGSMSQKKNNKIYNR